MGDHRKLKAWQAARVLAGDTYRITRSFPSEERFGLTMQARRAASSIMANLAEGCGRNGDRELLRFVRIAQGSAAELDSHLVLADDLIMAPTDKLTLLQVELSKLRGMLARLAKRLSDSLTDSR